MVPHRTDVLEALRALGPSPTPDDVDAVIGHDRWCRVSCDGCGDTDGPWVQVGDEPDYDSRTATLCAKCIRAAAALVPGTPIVHWIW